MPIFVLHGKNGDWVVEAPNADELLAAASVDPVFARAQNDLSVTEITDRALAACLNPEFVLADGRLQIRWNVKGRQP